MPMNLLIARAYIDDCELCSRATCTYVRVNLLHSYREGKGVGENCILRRILSIPVATNISIIDYTGALVERDMCY